MINSKNIILIALLFFTFTGSIVTAPVYIYLDKKKISKILPITIGSREYISFMQVSEIIFQKQDYKTSETVSETKNKKVKIAEGSFFIVYESATKMKVLQMTVPTIKHNNKLYLPMIDVIQIAVDNDLIAAIFVENKLIFRKLSNEIYDTYDFDTYSDYHSPPQNKNLKIKGYRINDTTSKRSILNNISKQEHKRLLKEKLLLNKNKKKYFSPTGYRIPKQMKRKEVEKLKGN